MERLYPMKKTAHRLIAEVPRRQSRIELFLTSVSDLAEPLRPVGRLHI